MIKSPHWPTTDNSNPINLGLERVVEALAKLGNPHHNLPPVIHVAGTNGKGSTIAFLRAMLEASGKKCHVYTSPHLVEFNERIVLAGKEISDEFLNEVIEETKSKCDHIPLTFFEGTTVAALLAFSKVKADFVLLETGLGGRLDATNVIAKPLMTIITPISYDHMEYLGETIAEIALEKASIIKENSFCIVSRQSEEALNVIKEFAKSKNAELSILDHDFSYQINNDHNFIYRDDVLGAGFPRPSLRGTHQYMNAATAIRAATKIGIDKKFIKTGIKAATWRARLQKIADNIYLDGGHNAEAGEIIKDFVLAENFKKRKHNIAMIGMLKTKDFASFIKNLAPAFNEIYAVPIPDTDHRDTLEIKKVCQELGVKCRAFEFFSEAYSTACNGQVAANNRVVICGSLYLAGSVLEKNLG